MNSKKYLLELCSLIGASMNTKFVSTSVQKLQQVVNNDIGNKPFIALVDSTETNGVTEALTVFNLTFISSVTLVHDPLDSELKIAEQEADESIKRFLYLIRQAPTIDVLSWTKSSVFRGGSYNGVGCGLSMSISLLDSEHYCEHLLPDFESLICEK